MLGAVESSAVTPVNQSIVLARLAHQNTLLVETLLILVAVTAQTKVL